VTAPSRGWRPLPECLACEAPTRRVTWAALGGRCSRCHAAGAAITRSDRLELSEWQTLARRRGQEERRAAAERDARRRARQERRQRR
jgi:hypothetical protein